eukprot:TRINITY_DN66615_c0_g1_i1.p1 TRINITY_DN66615_c0_g1~~TRINITY_DN66615_c0_g1_i1.p1  ORF type:complete len:328 (+),score=89.99 TRINITY_DN66615_c0_g1_i1:45-1028(+)
MEKTEWLKRSKSKKSVDTAKSSGSRSEASPFPQLDSVSRRDQIKKAAYILLEAANASQDQLAFFECWLKLVFDEAIGLAEAKGAVLSASSDLATVELSVKAHKRTMSGLAKTFMEACEVPEFRMHNQMVQVMGELEATDVALWCRLKRIGSEEQAVDAGFRAEGAMEWLVVDMLTPRSEDQAAVRNILMGDHHVPQGYAASLLPVEPESAVRFNLHTGTLQSSILSSLFIFKSMGFAKPQDAVLDAVTNMNAMGCSLFAAMGPQGLTRMVMRLDVPAKGALEKLSNACGSTQGLEALRAAEAELTAPGFVEFAAEARGYTVSAGFAA